MTWREFWLFLHLTAAMVWIGGAAAIQVFGILTKRAADPEKTAFFAANVSWTVSRIFLPASIVVFIAGVGLKVQEHWNWSEPFIVYGVIAWALVSLVAFGFLGGAIGRAGAELALEGPSPALALRMRNLVWLSRVLLVVLLTIVFMMTVKLGT
jgi:hypothetical protein